MQKEIEVAVKWWGDVLQANIWQDNGDLVHMALATWVRDRQEKPTDEQVEDFRSALTAILSKVLPRYWDKNEPMRGIACEGRCIHVDYGPDRVLAAAAQSAGIQYGTTLFPVKTTMWVSPGEVKVKQGYGGQTEYIYKAE